MHFKCALALAHRWRGYSGLISRCDRRCVDTHKQQEALKWIALLRQAPSLCPEKELLWEGENGS